MKRKLTPAQAGKLGGKAKVPKGFAKVPLEVRRAWHAKGGTVTVTVLANRLK